MDMIPLDFGFGTKLASLAKTDLNVEILCCVGHGLPPELSTLPFLFWGFDPAHKLLMTEARWQEAIEPWYGEADVPKNRFLRPDIAKVQGGLEALLDMDWGSILWREAARSCGRWRGSDMHRRLEGLAGFDNSLFFCQLLVNLCGFPGVGNDRGQSLTLRKPNICPICHFCHY